MGGRKKLNHFKISRPLLILINTKSDNSSFCYTVFSRCSKLSYTDLLRTLQVTEKWLDGRHLAHKLPWPTADGMGMGFSTSSQRSVLKNLHKLVHKIRVWSELQSQNEAQMPKRRSELNIHQTRPLTSFKYYILSTSSQ